MCDESAPQHIQSSGLAALRQFFSAQLRFKVIMRAIKTRWLWRVLSLSDDERNVIELLIGAELANFIDDSFDDLL